MPLSRRFAVVTVAMCVMLAACGGAEPVAETTTTVAAPQISPPTTNSLPTIDDGAETITLADGTQRRYLVSPAPDGADIPALVVVLHGIGGSAAGVRDYVDVETVAAELGIRAVAVYPEGSGDDVGFPQSWNAGGCCPFANLDDADDVGFLSAVIEKVRAEYATDPARTWVIGHSNGGMMAYRLACEAPSLVTAIGVGAGALMTPCTSQGAVNLVHLHGKQDVVVPFDGGSIAGISFPPVTGSLDAWGAAHECAAEADTVTWTCRNGTTARLVSDAAWGHEWQSSWTRTMLETFIPTVS